MTDSDSLSLLARVIAEGAGAFPAGQRETGIKDTLGKLFEDRYHSRYKSRTGFRDAYGLANDNDVPYAGMIAEENPPSGPYGGASLAWFPVEGGSLMTFVVGSRGLAPDEGLLTRPGHKRRVAALRRWLNELGVKAWSKQDPAAINIEMPAVARQLFPEASAAFRRYGREIYSIAWVPSDLEPVTARAVVQAFFDLYAHERNWEVRSERRSEFEGVVGPLRDAIFARVSAEHVAGLLRQRRFVIIQGPPGTGKTRMAETVRHRFFNGRGRTVQFHPAITYEDFVVGLAPDPTAAGLRFVPRAGWLVAAAQEAQAEPYVLIIDEINRGDLGKVLGEAIYLFEPLEVGADGREVTLPHAIHGTTSLKLPEHLYVLGTMNSADRSIASLDLAVRRRFAFITLMPDRSVVEQVAIPEAVAIFDRIASVFIEHASDDSLDLLPGHAYFLARDRAEFQARIRFEVLPLLDEYLRQGLVGPMATELQAIRDEIGDAVNRV